MSGGLATRCPACQTVFRVVRDQLRVSGGWVRCGRCSEVFDAGQTLLDLDTGLPWVDTAPPTPPPPPAARTTAAPYSAPYSAPPDPRPGDGRSGLSGLPAVFSTRGQGTPDPALRREPEFPAVQANPQLAPDLAPEAVHHSRPDDLHADPNLESARWRTTPMAPPSAVPIVPTGADSVPNRPPDLSASPAHDLPLDPLWRQTEAPDYEPLHSLPIAVDLDPGAAQPHTGQDTGPPIWPPLPPPPQDLEPLPPLSSLSSRGAELKVQAEPHYKPSFVRAADRAQRWRHPRTRAWLAAIATVAALGLLLQVGMAYRDLAAARVPTVKPVLQAVCALLSCTVGPALAINSLVVESSGLLRVDRSQQYRLQVALRNRAGIPVALPAIDVTLTDTTGAVVARKVLSAAEMGSTIDTLAPGQSLTLQATLQHMAAASPIANGDTGPTTIAGYTVEVFYP